MALGTSRSPTSLPITLLQHLVFSSSTTRFKYLLSVSRKILPSFTAVGSLLSLASNSSIAKGFVSFSPLSDGLIMPYVSISGDKSVIPPSIQEGSCQAVPPLSFCDIVKYAFGSLPLGSFPSSYSDVVNPISGSHSSGIPFLEAPSIEVI